MDTFWRIHLKAPPLKARTPAPSLDSNTPQTSIGRYLAQLSALSLHHCWVPIKVARCNKSTLASKDNSDQIVER
jgi:hypothetical protein